MSDILRIAQRMSENFLDFLGEEATIDDSASSVSSWMDEDGSQQRSSPWQQPNSPTVVETATVVANPMAVASTSLTVVTTPATAVATPMSVVASPPGSQQAPVIDLTTSSGRARINEVRDLLKDSENYFRTCTAMNFKLLQSTTTEIPAPTEVVAAIFNGIKSSSTKTIKKQFAKIHSYRWFIPYTAETERIFNDKKVAQMASFLSRGRLTIRFIASELRNTDFAALVTKPLDYITWAAFPEPQTKISPSVTAVALYAALNSNEVRRINNDCRRNNIRLRLAS